MTDRTEWGQEVIRLDGGHCQNPKCYWGGFSPLCDPHHIKSRSLGGEDVVENGISFCRVCHGWAEVGHREDGDWISAREFVIQILESHKDDKHFRWGKVLEWLKRKRK